MHIVITDDDDTQRFSSLVQNSPRFSSYVRHLVVKPAPGAVTPAPGAENPAPEPAKPAFVPERAIVYPEAARVIESSIPHKYVREAEEEPEPYQDDPSRMLDDEEDDELDDEEEDASFLKGESMCRRGKGGGWGGQEERGKEGERNRGEVGGRVEEQVGGREDKEG